MSYVPALSNSTLMLFVSLKLIRYLLPLMSIITIPVAPSLTFTLTVAFSPILLSVAFTEIELFSLSMLKLVWALANP